MTATLSPGTDLAPRCDFPVAIADQITLAKTLSEAGILPNHLRKNPENIIAIGYAARALNIPLFTAIQKVVPIEGKVGMEADLMRALILRAGHKFRITEATAEKATAVVIRRDDPEFEHVVEVKLSEIPDSVRKKDNWKNWTADMLVARATSKIARRACSDVLNGMIYTPEELGVEVDEEGEAVLPGPATNGHAGEPVPDGAAAKLRAAAASAGTQHPPSSGHDDVVDAEVVDPEVDDAVTGAATHEPAAGGAPQPAVAEQPAEQTVGDDPRLALRDVQPMTGLRRGLLEEAERRFGKDQATAEIEAHFDGLPLDRIRTDELRTFILSK